MSSKIKVDTIENVAGSGNVSLGSGHNLVVPGNITGQGTAAITSNATVGGTLGVTGTTTLSGNSTVGGTLGVTGASTFSGNVTVDTNVLKVDTSADTVGIHETTPEGRLHVNSTGQDNASGINLLLECTSGGGRKWAHRISETGVNNGWYVIRDETADKTRLQIHENAYFMINPINEETHVRVGTTGAIGTGYAGVEINRSDSNIGYLNIGKTYSGNASAVKFWYSASLVGQISYNNSSTAYNTSSDYRLKENVEYDFDATTRLKQLKHARCNFISDENNTLVDGFIAHEVSSIVPEAITGEKDATEKYIDEDGKEQTRDVMQGIDQSKLVPLLVKTIQELEARIAVLEAK